MNNPIAGQGSRAVATPRERALRRWPLIFAFFAGPAIWSMHELLGLIMVSWACSTRPGGFESTRVAGVSGWEWALILVTLVAISVVVGFNFSAFHMWKEAGLGTDETGTQGGASGRSGWMSLAAILLNTTFLIGIVLSGASIFFLSGCA